MNILVSACLLGNACRYDGKSKPSEKVISLGKNHRLIPVCPEAAGGLCVPRVPCERVGDKVISKEGADCTAQYKKGAEVALTLYKKYNCACAVLKANSPSCSNCGVYDGTFSGRLTNKQNGVTAELLEKHGIKVYNENEIDALVSEHA